MARVGAAGEELSSDQVKAGLGIGGEPAPSSPVNTHEGELSLWCTV